MARERWQPSNAELIRRPRESSNLSVEIRGWCGHDGHPRAFRTPHRLEKNVEIDGPSDGRFT